MMFLSFLSELYDEGWDDRWDEVHKLEMITMSSDNGTFTHTFSEEVTEYDRFEVNWCYSMDTYEGYDYYCHHSYQNGAEIVEIVEDKTDGRGEMVVGEYNEQNRTIWLTTDSHSVDEIEFEFEFIDIALQNELEYSGGDMVDTFFCLMPLAGIVAIAISFARGNKSLGYGLIASVSIPIVLGGLMLMLLLMFGF
jgi:hypothetical protein